MTETVAANKRCAIVTGGARGIGEAISRALLDAGLNVVLVDKDLPALEDFMTSLPDFSDSIAPVVADIGEAEGWDRILQVAHEKFGPVAILVNNAAISPKHDGKRMPSDVMPIEEWDEVIRVNLTGAFLGCQHVIPDMRGLAWGRIINISSQAARVGARVAGIHYGVAKSALLGLTRTLAYEFGHDGITVNTVTPGRIMTPMAAGVSDEVNNAMLKDIPVGRLGTPDDPAGLVRFLVSEDAGFITGATIDINGGHFMG